MGSFREKARGVGGERQPDSQRQRERDRETETVTERARRTKTERGRGRDRESNRDTVRETDRQRERAQSCVGEVMQTPTLMAHLRSTVPHACRSPEIDVALQGFITEPLLHKLR